MADFELSLSYLKRVDSSGRSFYTHLIDLLVQLQNKQIDESELSQHLQKLSVSLKTSQLNVSVPSEFPSDRVLSAEQQKQLTSAEFIQKLLQRAQNQLLAEKLPEYHQPSKAAPRCPRVPNFQSQSNLLSSAGLAGLSEDEALRLQLRVDGLVRAEGLESARFWGKIFGTKGDYWIVEATVDRRRVPAAWAEAFKALKQSEAQRLERVNAGLSANSRKKRFDETEAIGSGVNEYVYYCASNLNSSWVKLPLASPDMLAAARSIRSFFTGQLDRMISFPQFPYSEAHYLRAQIARISHSTHLAPKGALKVGEAEEEVPEGKGDDYEPEHWELVEPEDEFEVPSSEELGAPEGWIHAKAKLLRKGRLTPFVKPEVEESEENAEEQEQEEEEEENKEDEEAEAEEASGFLVGADGDELPELYTKEQRLEAIWRFRNSHRHASSKANSVVAENRLWPGAFTVARGSEYVSVYFGFGQKFLSSAFTPALPPPVAAEFVSKFDAEEEEVDVNKEQSDPLPPAEVPEEQNEDEEDDEEGDEEDDEGDEEEEEEEDN